MSAAYIIEVLISLLIFLSNKHRCPLLLLGFSTLAGLSWLRPSPLRQPLSPPELIQPLPKSPKPNLQPLFDPLEFLRWALSPLPLLVFWEPLNLPALTPFGRSGHTSRLTTSRILRISGKSSVMPSLRPSLMVKILLDSWRLGNYCPLIL